MSMAELNCDTDEVRETSPLLSVALPLPEINLAQKDKTYFGHSKKNIITIIIFSMGYLFSSAVCSLQAPFYPKEAESRGATASEYGFVLGVIQVVMFVMCPICGIIIGYISPRLVYTVGMFITAVGAISFGFLDYIEDHTTFIVLSILLRILQGIGDAAFVTATLSVLALQFPESVASVFAGVETFWGVGLLIGPGLGGALYELGGFLLPFLCMGSCQFVLFLGSCFLLPEASRPETLNQKKTSVWEVLRIPEVILVFFSVIVTANSSGFLVATLEPHLRANFALTPAQTGLVFMIDGFTYAFSTPIWGKLCDNSKEPKMYIVIGALLSFSGFLFVGPAPYIPLKPILWQTCMGLVCHGVATGAIYVAGFIQAMQGSVKNGLPDNVSTYGHISGLFVSVLTLGMFAGSSIGGILLDNFGFKMSSIYVLATEALVVVLTIIFMGVSNKLRSQAASTSKTNSDTEHLLENEHS